MTAHRALPRCTGACDQGRRNCGCTTGHVIDRLPEDYDEPQPLTWRESVQFWTTVSAPAIGMGLVWVFVVWVCKP